MKEGVTVRVTGGSYRGEVGTVVRKADWTVRESYQIFVKKLGRYPTIWVKHLEQDGQENMEGV